MVAFVVIYQSIFVSLGPVRQGVQLIQELAISRRRNRLLEQSAADELAPGLVQSRSDAIGLRSSISVLGEAAARLARRVRVEVMM